MPELRKITTIAELHDVITPDNAEKFAEAMKEYVIMVANMKSNSNIKLDPFISWLDDGSDEVLVKIRRNDGRS